MISLSGRLIVDLNSERIYVDLPFELTRYYAWFIAKRYWVNLRSPSHGCHITLTNPKITSHTNVDWKKARRYNGRTVNFKYDPHLCVGLSRITGFYNVYAKIFSDQIDKIKSDLNIIEKDGYQGMHVTFGNLKEPEKLQPYWPKMIELK